MEKFSTHTFVNSSGPSLILMNVLNCSLTAASLRGVLRAALDSIVPFPSGGADLVLS
jgi:hypothetical protein